MILKKMEIHNYGPFSTPATLHLSSDITILIGRNDVGKSLILDLIEIVTRRTPSIEQKHINLQRFFELSGDPLASPEIKCTTTFEVSGIIGGTFGSTNLEKGDIVTIHTMLAPKYPTGRRSYGPFSKVSARVGQMATMPSVIRVDPNETFKNSFDLNNLTPIESTLIDIAFGDSGHKKLLANDREYRSTILEEGNERLNKLIVRFLPPTINFKVTINIDDHEKPNLISLRVRDEQKANTPILYRGTGVNKILSIIIKLIGTNLSASHFIILLDEPENSLHADAQYTLRNFLEELSRQESIQVVYATHSPSMLNPISWDGIRLIKRPENEGSATSVIDNFPLDENFEPIRKSLGILPTDSLLFGILTIICEGKTDRACLPMLLSRLCAENVKGFEDVKRLLSIAHIIDGGGDSFQYWFRLAEAQGSKPLIFVDGDKIRRIRQLKIEEQYPEVPIISLPDGTEIENIVPVEFYIQALQECLCTDLRLEEFEAWRASNHTIPWFNNLLLSKQIDNWIKTEHSEMYYDKKKVMLKAIEITPTDQMSIEPFRNLVTAMSRLISS